MSGPKPTRTSSDLADMLDTLLDKGVVINADIAVSVGDTELLGVTIRAAIASFETAAKYGLAFPSGTDMERVHDAAGVDPVEGPPEDLDIDASRTDGGGDSAHPDADPERRGDSPRADDADRADDTDRADDADPDRKAADGDDAVEVDLDD